MPNKKLNPKHLWIQFEDVLAPRLGLNIKERAVYSYLLRHSLVIGKPCIRFAVSALARTLGISAGLVRDAVRRLDELGALHVLKRDKTGHDVEMRLPEKIQLIHEGSTGAAGAEEAPSAALDSRDFWKTWALRKAIHDRERGFCFYCLRRTLANVRCLDHVVPRVRYGRNSYRNLVSCCIECNSLKGDTPAADFLRMLCRKGRLTTKELDGRLCALKELAGGKLRPALYVETRNSKRQKRKIPPGV
jgi:5-methylcytosine-specific restriction endonuclease McrA